LTRRRPKPHEKKKAAAALNHWVRWKGGARKNRRGNRHCMCQNIGIKKSGFLCAVTRKTGKGCANTSGRACRSGFFRGERYNTEIEAAVRESRREEGRRGKRKLRGGRFLPPKRPKLEKEDKRMSE